jgi:site-specific recombinase XerD
MKLVESSIARISVPPGKREAYLWDETLPGFGVRAFASGKKSFVVKYSLASGQQRKISLGPALPGTLVETRRKAQDILARARIGQDVQGEKKAERVKKTSAAGTLIRRYLESRRSELRPRSFREVDRHLALLFSSLHEKQTEAITRRDVVEIVDRIAAENGRATADRAKASVGTFFAWCMEREFIDANPAMGIKRRAPSRPAFSPVLSSRMRYTLARPILSVRATSVAPIPPLSSVSTSSAFAPAVVPASNAADVESWFAAHVLPRH